MKKKDSSALQDAFLDLQRVRANLVVHADAETAIPPDKLWQLASVMDGAIAEIQKRFTAIAELSK